MSDVEAFLGRVEELASRATEGPWEADGAEVSQHWSRPKPWVTVVSSEVACMAYCYGGIGRGIERETDAEFIAAARTDVPALVAALRAVLELHRPGSYSVSMDGWTAHPVCPTCHDKAGVHPCGCWREVDEDHVCLGCSRPGKGVHTQWPCPTVQAIADALGIGGEEKNDDR